MFPESGWEEQALAERKESSFDTEQGGNWETWERKGMVIIIHVMFA